MLEIQNSLFLKFTILTCFCVTLASTQAQASHLQCVNMFDQPQTAFAGVDIDLIREMQARHKSKQEKMLQILTTSQGFEKLEATRGIVADHDNDFTFELPEKAVRGDQGQTGDCYVEAPFNAIEEFAMSQQMLFGDQTLSRPYMLFFTYLEKSGKHIDKIIAMRRDSVKLGNQTILKKIKPAITDGGYSDEVLFFLKKYGAVLESAMPQNANSRNSGPLLAELNSYLYKKSYELWNLAEAFDKKSKALQIRMKTGQDKVELERMTADQMKVLLAEKRNILGGAFLILEKGLGTPPTTFTTQLPIEGSKEGQQASVMRTFTPREFALNYLKINPDEWVNVSNLRTLPRNQVYQVKFQDMNVPVRRLNLDARRMKHIIRNSLLAGVRVPFDSNFGPGVNVRNGDMKLGTDSTEGMFPWSRKQAPRKMSPFEMTMLNITDADHETEFTGFLQPKGHADPLAFKVENQWTDQVGFDGNFKMYGDWFDLYVDGIMVHKSFLTADELAIYEGKPVILPAINE